MIEGIHPKWIMLSFFSSKQGSSTKRQFKLTIDEFVYNLCKIKYASTNDNKELSIFYTFKCACLIIKYTVRKHIHSNVFQL